MKKVLTPLILTGLIITLVFGAKLKLDSLISSLRFFLAFAVLTLILSIYQNHVTKSVPGSVVYGLKTIHKSKNKGAYWANQTMYIALLAGALIAFAWSLLVFR